MTVSVDLKKFNDYISTRSYISGYAVSNLDLEMFDVMGTAPEARYEHALRWYNHIKAVRGSCKAECLGKESLHAYPFIVGAAAQKPAGDDFDLFGDEEEEDPEVAAAKAKKIAEYEAKKAKKPAVVAKSEVELDVKPWDEETDMKKLLRAVKEISMDGLVWGEAKLVPLAYGINKLSVKCVVEDDKVSVDDLCEQIGAFEDHVQSVDVVSFNKL